MASADLNPASLSVPELMSVADAALGELRRRRVVRTTAAPLDEYVVWLTTKSLGGDRSSKSEQAFAIFTPMNRRMAVRTGRVSTPPKPAQLETAPFSSFEFDDALLVLVDDETLEVRQARVVPAWLVRQVATVDPKTESSSVAMDGTLMEHPDAVDVTDKLRQAAGSTVAPAKPAAKKSASKAAPKKPAAKKPSTPRRRKPLKADPK